MAKRWQRDRENGRVRYVVCRTAKVSENALLENQHRTRFVIYSVTNENRKLPDSRKNGSLTIKLGLSNPEADGFLVRRVYAEVPTHTEYALTPRAHSFMAACRPMVDWAIDNFAAIKIGRASCRERV